MKLGKFFLTCTECNSECEGVNLSVKSSSGGMYCNFTCLTCGEKGILELNEGGYIAPIV